MPGTGHPDTERHLALRIVTLPRDTNHYGTIFGGVILSYIDQAGFVAATRHGQHRWVTVAMDKVVFKQPVQVGDTVSFYAKTVREGRTSVTVLVEVEAVRFDSGLHVPVTEATLTMVSVDTCGKPIPFASPPTIGVHASKSVQLGGEAGSRGGTGCDGNGGPIV